MSPEELAAIMADHAAPHTCIGGWFKNAESSRSMPCLPYRLAAELTAERAKVERVEALCKTWETPPSHDIGKRIRRTHAMHIRAALDDDPRTETVTLKLHSPVATDNTNDAGTLYVCEQSGCGWGWRTHDEQDATSKWSDAHTDGAA